MSVYVVELQPPLLPMMHCGFCCSEP